MLQQICRYYFPVCTPDGTDSSSSSPLHDVAAAVESAAAAFLHAVVYRGGDVGCFCGFNLEHEGHSPPPLPPGEESGVLILKKLVQTGSHIYLEPTLGQLQAGRRAFAQQGKLDPGSGLGIGYRYTVLYV